MITELSNKDKKEQGSGADDEAGTSSAGQKSTKK